MFQLVRMFVVLFGVLISLIGINSLNIVPDYAITPRDKIRFLNVFESALSKKPDVALWHYSILGYHLIELKPFPKLADACKLFKNTLQDSNFEVEKYFHAIEGIMLINSLKSAEQCELNAPTDLGNKLTKFVDGSMPQAHAQDIFYAVSSLNHLKLKKDPIKIAEILKSISAKDSSAVTQSYLFQIAAISNLAPSDLRYHFKEIEDVVNQADEINEKFLYLETGLFHTSFLVEAIYKLCEKVNEIPVISEDKILKLTNYLLSRKYIYQPKAAVYLILALRTLSENKKIIPATVRIENSNSITSKDGRLSSNLNVKLATAWGNSIRTKIFISQITSDNISLLKNPINFAYDSSKDLYSADLNSLKLKPGFYDIEIGGSGISEDGFILVGLHKMVASLSFKIMRGNINVGPVIINSIETESNDEISDSLSTSSLNNIVLDFDNKLISIITVDSHVKLQIAISISESTPDGVKPFRPHQCFLRLEHIQKKNEVFLIAEPDARKKQTDKLTMLVTINTISQVKDFDYISGEYSMELLIADSLSSNSVMWTIGTVDLKLPSKPLPPPTAPSANVNWADAPILPNQPLKKEIHHIFRAAEKRAPYTIMFTFSILCVVPIFILFGLWFKLGLNIDGISKCPIYAIIFHICLGAIFFLYYCYWTYLNMFKTLWCLALLAVPTFLSGNKMLLEIALSRLQNKNMD